MEATSRDSGMEPARCPACNGRVAAGEDDKMRHGPCRTCGNLLWYDPHWEMLSGLLVPDACLPELGGVGKEDAYKMMIEALIEAGAVPDVDVDELVRGLLDREQLGAVGCGGGVAVPHLRDDAIQQPVANMAYTSAGIDFSNPDGRHSHLLVMILSPKDQPRQHLRALERISAAARGVWANE